LGGYNGRIEAIAGRRQGAAQADMGGTNRVTKDPQQAEETQAVELKDPVLAAFLAWLIPGLGHLYQGRTAKGVLFLVCILGTFVYGVYLGGSRELGWGRVVYASWTADDKRIPYLGQVFVGLPALPALVQTSRVRSGNKPWLGGFMAPPLPDSALQNPFDQPTLDTLHKKLHRYFELGTVYTLIAGMLNILAIYDAYAGPVFMEKEGEEEGEEGQNDVPASETKAD
jgi:TM2 domain-containing membrane protein YozV